MLNKGWIKSPNAYTYTTPNNEHNWDDMCIQLRNQQTCNFHKP